MVNVLEDDRYYSKYDKAKWVWVQVDPNEPRDIKSKYMETHQGVGFDPTKNMTSAVFKLVDRLEYEAINNPSKLEQLKNENPKAWVNIIAKNMNLLQSSQEVEYFFDEAFRQGVQWFKTSEYKKLNSEIKNDKNLIKALSNKGLHFIAFADKETQKQLVLENEKFLKHVSGNYVEEFTEAIKLQNAQQDFQEENIEQKPITETKQEEINQAIKVDNAEEVEEIVEEGKVAEIVANVDDKEEQVKAVMENPKKFSKLSIELQLELLEQNPMLIDYASYDVYYKNAEFVNKLIAKEPRILQSGKVGYGIREEHLKQAIEQNPFAIQYVEEYAGTNAHKYVKMAIESNPECLSVISKHAQISVIRSFSEGEELLKHASNEVQETMISRDASYLAYASREVRNNDEVVSGAIAKNPLMYQYASDRLRDDVEIQRNAVKADFNVYKMLPMEAKQNPEFEPQREKVSIVDKFVFGAIKLEDIDKQNFVDINFYNTIVQESKNKVLRQFDSLTQGMEMSDKIEEKLQAQVEKKLKQIEKKLQHQRNWALLKNGIKTKIDAIKEDFNRGFQAGQVASEIKHMEL